MWRLEAGQYRGQRSRINKSASGLPSGVLSVFFQGMSFHLPGNCFQVTFRFSSGMLLGPCVFVNIRQNHTNNTIKIIIEPGMQRLWSGVRQEILYIHIQRCTVKY